MKLVYALMVTSNILSEDSKKDVVWNDSVISLYPRGIQPRINHQPGFVLHSYPYSETSLIVEVFTKEHGRVALMAKGAKRGHSQLRPVLQRFQLLSLSWSGKSEVRTLIASEWVGGMLPLEKSALLCGFYLNELLLKLLAREDPHVVLFNHYVGALNQLAHGEDMSSVLRCFEIRLLKELGVSVSFGLCQQSGAPVKVDGRYVVEPERGARPALVTEVLPVIAGKTLLDMERGDYSDKLSRAQSKVLLRALLAHHLAGSTLNTRQILIDLLQW